MEVTPSGPRSPPARPGVSTRPETESDADSAKIRNRNSEVGIAQDWVRIGKQSGVQDRLRDSRRIRLRIASPSVLESSWRNDWKFVFENFLKWKGNLLRRNDWKFLFAKLNRNWNIDFTIWFYILLIIKFNFKSIIFFFVITVHNYWFQICY